MKLVIDRDCCIGSGMCVLSAPDVFDQGLEDGRVVSQLTTDVVSGDLLAVVRDAVNACPTGALSLVDVAI